MNVCELAPGTVISFDDMQQVSQFEDAVAKELDPELDGELKDFWDSRAPIKGLVRPDRFNGTIKDVSLTVMDAPFDRYVDAKERGWVFNKGYYVQAQKGLNQDIIESYAGFIFTANALSTAHSPRQIQAELWITSYGLCKYSRKHLASKGDSSVKRLVTRPKLETQDFIVPDASAKQIGFSALLHT